MGKKKTILKNAVYRDLFKEVYGKETALSSAYCAKPFYLAMAREIMELAVSVDEFMELAGYFSNNIAKEYFIEETVYCIHGIKLIVYFGKNPIIKKTA